MLAPDQAVFDVEHLERPHPGVVDQQDDDAASVGGFVRLLHAEVRIGRRVGVPDCPQVLLDPFLFSSPCRCHTTSGCKNALYVSQSRSFSARKKRASVSTAFTGAP